MALVMMMFAEERRGLGYTTHLVKSDYPSRLAYHVIPFPLNTASFCTYIAKVSITWFRLPDFACVAHQYPKFTTNSGSEFRVLDLSHYIITTYRIFSTFHRRSLILALTHLKPPWTENPFVASQKSSGFAHYSLAKS